MRFDKRWLTVLPMGILLVGGTLFVKARMPETATENKEIETRLLNIESALSQLQGQIKSPAAPIDLSPVNQALKNLTASMEQLKSKDDNHLNQLITENSNELTHKLDAIQQVIHELDKDQHKVKYLPATALPFKIVSIDSIQQVSVATVSYDFKTIPLEKTDTLAGWTVLQIDFGKQRLELENHNKERVLVKLGNHHD